MSPAPRVRHQLILGNLYLSIANFLIENPIGSVLLAPTDVLLSNHDIVQPDILFVPKAYQDIRNEKNIQGAPELAIEILSEGNRRYDEITKRNLYESFGIKEYWIVDPVIETIKIYSLISGKYNRVAELSRENNDSLSSEILSGFTCSLKEIFG